MIDNQSPFETSDQDKNQSQLAIDDGCGLRVVSAEFVSEEKFDWGLFSGFDTLRVLTYSVSAPAVVRMLEKYSFTSFECIFGYQGILRDFKDILSFQKLVIGDTRAAIMGLEG